MAWRVGRREGGGVAAAAAVVLIAVVVVVVELQVRVAHLFTMPETERACVVSLGRAAASP